MSDGPAAIIIGGGGTGAALVHDLTRRGFRCTLFERGELTSGTTGRHHGQLHSGARYAVGDAEIARECMTEVNVLRAIAAESIEMNYGLFLALPDTDDEYADRFASACTNAGIPHRRVTAEQARRYEPRISPETRYAFVVPDGTLDAYRLPLQFFATARVGGASIRSFVEVVGIDVASGRVRGVVVFDHRTGREERHEADVVINAAGPWAGRVAALAGVDLPLTPAPGTLVAVSGRLTNMVVSHLHPPGDGDIVVPQRTLSIIGSTQWETDDPESATRRDEDVAWLLSRADLLVPGFSRSPVRASWAAVRPLAERSDSGGRALSRDFAVVSHASAGVSGFVSLIGGKATVLRAMAQRGADAVCSELGVDVPCTTATTPLLSHREYFRRNA